MSDANTWNRSVIEEFRAHSGRLGGGFEGSPVLILHTIGAKSGRTHATPMSYTRDGDRLIVVAAAGGAPLTFGVSGYVICRATEAEAKATEMVSTAIGKSGSQAINYFVAQKYVEAIGMFATSPNAKTILFPVEATQLIGTLGGIGELVKDALGKDPK